MVSAPYALQAFSGDLFNKEVITQTKEALEQSQSTRDSDQGASK